MKLSDFSYELPPHLIAEFPAERRSDSRLLTLKRGSGETAHLRFNGLPELLREGDLLVCNDTRVIPARLFGRKASGGRVEVMLERILGENRVLAQLRVSKKPAPGSTLLFDLPDADAPLAVTVRGREGEFFLLEFPDELPLTQVLSKIGHMPLPPYIERPDTPVDAERYQTVYARQDGAVAAPTAGLHFDDELLAELARRGIRQAFLTLHVGAGTFQPVRVENVTEHRMHSEFIEVSEDLCDAIRQCKAGGGRVVAVGTTTVRSLETAARSGTLQPYQGDTDIFIYPGFEFQVVDAMITNFHLPESTLLMLVSAFCGQKVLLDAYKEAIEEEYRFFSYGDAMFLY